MESSSKERWVALTGVGFILALVASFIVMGGDPPGADEGGQKVLEYYSDNEDQVKISALLSGLIVVLLVFFFAYVGKLIGRALPDSKLPTVGIVGAGMVGIAGALDSTLSFALADAADDLDPSAAQAIQAIWDNDFIPFMVGTAVAMLGVGIGVVRSGILPKWLGWVAVAAGLITMTPVGFAGAPLSALWIIVASIMLAVRAGRPAAAPPAPAA